MVANSSCTSSMVVGALPGSGDALTAWALISFPFAFWLIPSLGDSSTGCDVKEMGRE